jgi:hypothetical protein
MEASMLFKAKLFLAISLPFFLCSVAEAQERDLSSFKRSETKIETDLAKMNLAATQPKKMALGKNTGSTFDLAKGGLEHLVLSSSSSIGEVWPMVYLGETGNVHVYREINGYGWIWLFSPDKIQFITGGFLYDFDSVRYVTRIP